jgi:hypothetical protein
MKRYLMTWYGITDFRASLGLEETSGPILSALLAEDYSDVVILGYTKSENTNYADSNEPEQFHTKLSEIKNPAHVTDPAPIWQFIELFSNTEVAHKHFTKWLEEQIQGLGKKTGISFRPIYLQHLNDTEGIYEAASESLQTVTSRKDEKLVTLYLSPGTPVMAFVWAFAALRFPNLKKRLIASSQPNKPPETIILPNEWLEWHGKQIKTLANNTGQYDVIFHLFGEQRVPNLLGVLQFPSKKHVFVNSKQFPAEVMKQFIDNAEFVEVIVDPYDPENVRTAILDLLETMPPNIQTGFNLTGGTKLMYAGALAACRKVNATPFYFNSRNHKVIFLNDFRSTDSTTITSVETFIKLNADNIVISKAGHWNDIPGIKSPDRKKLTLALWNARSKIVSLYKELIKYKDSSKPFEISRNKIHVKLAKNENAEIQIKGEGFHFKNWPGFARYLSGGWLEEYTYMRLEPFVQSGLIKDLRIGMEVSLDSSSDFSEQGSNPLGDIYQELDLAFTDGRNFYVVECKAGSIKSEYVMKLQNIARYFGGVEGRAILAACFPPHSNVTKKKIDDSKNIRLASGARFCEQLEAIIQAWIV